MKVRCKHCIQNEVIDIPIFSKTDKKVLYELKINSPIHLVKYLLENFNLSHLGASI